MDLISWAYGLLTFIPWSLLEKVITPEFRNFLINMSQRVKAKQVENQVGKRSVLVHLVFLQRQFPQIPAG